MQTAARYAAAIEVLDTILAGTPAEKALTAWARSHRFAGSKDRAAIRDHVFDALRQKRSCAALGGDETGRGLILGLCQRSGADVHGIFSGIGHAPLPLSEGEQELASLPVSERLAALPDPVRLDCPDWLFSRFIDQMGDGTASILSAQQERAPVFLRVNRLRGTADEASASLTRDGITVEPVANMKNALKATENARKIKLSDAYLSGLVELQDVSSQASVEALDLAPGARVLDYCAGGGGKALALCAHPARPAAVFAHDAAPERMRDLPERAKRAGATVTPIATENIAQEAPFDLVFVDAPCSGSGTWRRTPDAKWRFSEADLKVLLQTQSAILQEACTYVREGGQLSYATCALLREENEDQITRFIEATPGWSVLRQKRADLSIGGDGFFSAALRRDP